MPSPAHKCGSALTNYWCFRCNLSRGVGVDGAVWKRRDTLPIKLSKTKLSKCQHANRCRYTNFDRISIFLMDTFWEITRLCSNILEPTRLCPETLVPTHVCAHTCFCTYIFVPSRQWQTRLCPDTYLVPWHAIIKWRNIPVGILLVIAELKLNNHILLRFANNSWACLYFHKSSWLLINLVDTIIISLLNFEQGHDRVWPQ